MITKAFIMPFKTIYDQAQFSAFIRRLKVIAKLYLIVFFKETTWGGGGGGVNTKRYKSVIFL